MGVFEIVVVFVVAWWLVFLPVLSMGSQSQIDAGKVVPGTEPGAPTKTTLVKKAIIAAIGATILTALLWIVLTFQLLTPFLPAL